jgi:hypothetical protein
MDFLNTPLFVTLLGFSTIMFGLAILTQILQEVYKYITSSKSKAYSKAITDFLGAWATRALQSNLGIIARGPFQWMRLRPRGNLLPLEKEQLVNNLEKSAPYWINRMHSQLKKEIKFQNSENNVPTDNWQGLLTELGKVEKGTSGYWDAYEIAKWLTQNKHVREISENSRTIGSITHRESFDPSYLLDTFQENFMPHILEAETQFGRFQQNFEFTYKRRNLRQTFIIALVFSILFQLNISRIYRMAENMPSDEAISLYLNYQQLQEQLDTQNLESTEDVKKILEQAKTQMIKDFGTESGQDSIKDIMIPWSKVESMAMAPLTGLVYIFECLITALLICFGAPIWNDIATFFFNLQKGRSNRRSNSVEGKNA